MEKTVLKDNWFLLQAEAGADIGALIGQARPETALPVREMPMEVADVLIDQNVIDLPWKPGLCEQSGWIAQSDWVYLCDFTLADADGIWRLSCAGLDVFAEIYLNGSKAASHANAPVSAGSQTARRTAPFRKEYDRRCFAFHGKPSAGHDSGYGWQKPA